MRLQVATRLALFAALRLAADPREQVAAAEIAERFGVSVNHLAKVLRILGRAGLVEAVRGAGGGYRFRGNVKRVTLLEVILLFEELASNPSDEASVPTTAEERALRRVVDEIDDIARATLSSITLATMLKLMAEPAEPARAAEETRAAPRPRRARASGS